MELPIELWMRVFELIKLDTHHARTHVIENFSESIKKLKSEENPSPASEQDCVCQLPSFELQAWKATRPYYAINRITRAAAIKLNLSSLMLRTCLKPLTTLPFGMGENDVTEATKAQRDTAIKSGHVVLEMFNPAVLKQLGDMNANGMGQTVRLFNLSGPGFSTPFMRWNHDVIPFCDTNQQHLECFRAAAKDPEFGKIKKIDLLIHSCVEPSYLKKSIACNARWEIGAAWGATGRIDGVLKMWAD